MTTKDKIARRKLSLLDLENDQDNISKACRLTGLNRTGFIQLICIRTFAFNRWDYRHSASLQ